MQIEVIYASADKQVIVHLAVADNCTVMQGIQQSGILKCFSEIDLKQQKVGIFSKRVDLATPLRAGDRVEIYRPLIIDPKKARLQRACG